MPLRGLLTGCLVVAVAAPAVATHRPRNALPPGIRMRLNADVPVYGLAFSPDGRYLAAGGANRMLRLWDSFTGRELFRLDGHTSAIMAVTFSPDGKLLATASADRTIRLWDVATGKTRHCLTGHQNDVTSIAFSPDGRLLASASWDKTVRLWDPVSGRELRQLPPQQTWLSSVVFAPDGQTLAVGSYLQDPEATVRVWDTTRGRELQRFQTNAGAEALAFSPDGRTLVSAHTGGRLVFWELARAGERWRVERRGDCKGLAFSPDGKWLASVGAFAANDPPTCLWNLADGTASARLAAHGARFTRGVAFTRDGRRLATGAEDGSVFIWDVAYLTAGTSPRSQDPSPEDLAVLWHHLARTDSGPAYRAVWGFVRAPGQSVPFLRDQIRLPRPVEPRRLDRLIGDLDSNRFAVRENASTELERLGAQAVPALRRVLEQKPSLEVRRRAERLLEGWKRSGPEELRQLRAVEALELIGSPEARQVLASLAGGAPNLRLAREAKAALARLAGRCPRPGD